MATRLGTGIATTAPDPARAARSAACRPGSRRRRVGRIFHK
jgi:hypothetical protein